MSRSSNATSCGKLTRRRLLLSGLASPAVVDILAREAEANQGLNKPLIIFAPGIMGSVLKSGNQTIFPSDANALYKILIHNPRLLEYDGHAADTTEVLETIQRWTPWLNATSPLIPSAKLNIYGKLAKRLERIAWLGRELELFSYDWRQDLFDTRRQLRALLKDKLQLSYAEDGKAQPSDRDVILVGHSMGAVLMTLSVIMGDVHPDNIRALILVAPPLGGSPKAFRTTMDATQFPFLNEMFWLCWGTNYVKALENLHRVIRTFPSIYQLMPPPGSNAYFRIGKLNKVVNPWDRGWFANQYRQAAIDLHTELDKGFANFPKKSGNNKLDVHLIYGSEVPTDVQYFGEEVTYAGAGTQFLLAGKHYARSEPEGDGTVLEVSAKRIDAGTLPNTTSSAPYPGAEHVALCGMREVLQLIDLKIQFT